MHQALASPTERPRPGSIALGPPRHRPGPIALLGVSLGGYLAPRAATAEHRLAALVADPGQPDLGRVATGRLPPELAAKLEDDVAAGEFEKLLDLPRLTRLFAPRMAAYGLSTVQEYLRAIREFSSPVSPIGSTAQPDLRLRRRPGRLPAGPAALRRLRCEKFFLFTDE
jgi:hypothetical protein